MKSILSVLVLTLATSPVWAQRGGNTNPSMLAVGQGISSPALSSPVNYSNGFTTENAAVASQLASPMLSLEYDTGDNNGSDVSGFGGELGIGNGQMGLIVGTYKRDCDNCENRTGAIAGFNFGAASIGVGYREDNQYSVGALFGVGGPHRVGLTADMTSGSGNDPDLTTYGVGYSYLGNQWIFAVDASKRDLENGGSANDILMITPGLLVQANDWLGLSVSYDLYTNDENDVFDDQLWVGLGLGRDRFNLAIYHDYVNEWSVVGTIRF